MKNILRVSIGVVILSFLISAVAYPLLPEKIASHWNYLGQPDAYSQKFWSLFLIPAISFLLIVLFTQIPKLDPLKKNYRLFSKHYNGFILVLVIFLFYINLLMVTFNAFFDFNILLAMLPAFSFLFFYIGILLDNAKRNWFVGIRTPWTLSSEFVWEKTHHFGGKLFRFSAVLMLLGMLFPRYSIWFILVPILASALVIIIYSYFVFKKLK